MPIINSFRRLFIWLCRAFCGFLCACIFGYIVWFFEPVLFEPITIFLSKYPPLYFLDNSRPTVSQIKVKPTDDKQSIGSFTLILEDSGSGVDLNKSYARVSYKNQFKQVHEVKTQVSKHDNHINVVLRERLEYREFWIEGELHDKAGNSAPISKVYLFNQPPPVTQNIRICTYNPIKYPHIDDYLNRNMLPMLGNDLSIVEIELIGHATIDNAEQIVSLNILTQLPIIAVSISDSLEVIPVNQGNPRLHDNETGFKHGVSVENLYIEPNQIKKVQLVTRWASEIKSRKQLEELAREIKISGHYLNLPHSVDDEAELPYSSLLWALGESAQDRQTQ